MQMTMCPLVGALVVDCMHTVDCTPIPGEQVHQAWKQGCGVHEDMVGKCHSGAEWQSTLYHSNSSCGEEVLLIKLLDSGGQWKEIGQKDFGFHCRADAVDAKSISEGHAEALLQGGPIMPVTRFWG